MSRPWSPAEAEQDLYRVINELDEVVTNLRNITQEAALARVDFEMAEDKAFMKYRLAGVTIEESKKRARLDCEDLFRTHVLAEAQAKSAYKAVDVRKSQADGIRSLLVSARGVSS